MNWKRVLGLLLAVSMLLSAQAVAAGKDDDAWSRIEGNGKYVTVRLSYPQGEGMLWSQYSRLCVRYADTKEPVALSSEYLSGYIFATVPARDVNRELEVYLGEPTQFFDCYTTWTADGKTESFYDAPLGTNALNIRGIIRGDQNGQLDPKEVITRAEAFAIICRLLSLQAGADPGYSDVSKKDWYYETASAARAAGLTVETESFDPLRPVTRGEITVMLCRAMKSIGWLTTGTGSMSDLDLVDAESIPDWALEAYLAFEPYNIGIFSYQDTDQVDEFGGYVQQALAEQDRGASRQDVIQMVYNALRFVPVYPTQTAVAWGFDREMPVIDGSTSTLPYTHAVYGALFSNSYYHPSRPEKHSKSYYSYDRLISGEADILFISTKPTQDTLAKAQAAGVELELIPIAYDAMVFFTNIENSADDLSMEQIREIYVNNTYDNWSQLGGPDAGLIPYCRNMDSGSQAQMEEFFLKGDEIHPNIRQETTAISMASVLTDVWEAKTEEPLAYALGYSIYYYYQQASYILLPDDVLKLLSVDGVYPTEQTIADGSYPLAGYNYAVIRADSPEDSMARKMVEFMTSPEGQQCVVNAGFGALK